MKIFTLEYFQAAGARGGAIGGPKASKNMTAQQRQERAKKAMAARTWRPKLTDEVKAGRLAAKRPVGRPRKETT